jgi:hypothetical protein
MFHDIYFLSCSFIAGATLYKCINRGKGTFLAGSLGVGVQWAANHLELSS